MSLILEGIPLTPPLPEHPPASARAAPHAPDQPSEFERVLRGVGAAIDRGEALLDAAARAPYQQMDAQTLIALQAGIYRYSEAIDLLSKFVDRVASGARTIVQAGH